MDCPNFKNNIGKDRTGDVICIPSLKGECNIQDSKTKEKCDIEIKKEGYLR